MKSEIENYGLDHVIVIGWINARDDAAIWDRVGLVIMGQLDGARACVGWHSELAEELELLREVARARYVDALPSLEAVARARS